MECKTNFSSRLKQFDGLTLTDPDPVFTTDLYTPLFRRLGKTCTQDTDKRLDPSVLTLSDLEQIFKVAVHVYK